MADSNMDLDLQLQLVSGLVCAARASLDEGTLLQACLALEELSEFVSSYETCSYSIKAIHAKYCEQNFHHFIREKLSDPCVSADILSVEALYVTFQKVLKCLSPDDLKVTVHTEDYIQFFGISVIRDTAAFCTLTDVVIATLYIYVSEMEGREVISVWNSLDFHETIATLLGQSSSSESVVKATKLLSCMVEKYYDHLDDVKPFVRAGIPHILLEKANSLANDSQFSDYFNIVMLLLTSDRTASLQLFHGGYLERLLDALCNPRMLGIRTSVIHVIANIALAGQQTKQLLLDRQFYTFIFSLLCSLEISTVDSFLITGCCRILTILASDYLVKRKFVDAGCIQLLLRVTCGRQQDSNEVHWRVLNLLDSFIEVISEEFVLASTILEMIAFILRNSNNGKVLYHATVLFLDACEFDSGARRLTEIGAVEALRLVIASPVYCNEMPELRHWGLHVLETQNLYTLRTDQCTAALRSPTHHPSDWPHNHFKEEWSKMDYPSDIGTLSSSSFSSVLPLPDETTYTPNTPMAPELTQSCLEQLANLGLDSRKPLFRVGRFYGNNRGHCRICNEDHPSEELVMRTQGLTLEQYQHLVDCGWNRRGGVKLFRLRHCHDSKCCYWETRVLVKSFDHKSRRSFKKVLKRMPKDRLMIKTCPPHFNKQAFDLYNKYHVSRFQYGIESENYYCEHVVDTPITNQAINGVEYGTFHQMYHLDGKLVAVEVVDVIPKGIVSVYMWYDVSREVAKYSFGVYSVLKDIEMVRAMSEQNPQIEYYYLQGWNKNSKGLSYKSNYQPEEFYCPCIVMDWVPFGELENNSCGDMNNDCSISVDSDITSDGEPSRRPFPLDMRRYVEKTGKELDIGNIVVCLNYAEFLCVTDLFKHHVKDKDQREIMETRLKELYVSLCPELRNQLVIDIAVCNN